MLVTLLGIVTLIKRVHSENSHPDAGEAIADRGVGQAGAGFECAVPEIGDAVGDCHADQAGALVERHVPDADYAAGIVTFVRPLL